MLTPQEVLDKHGYIVMWSSEPDYPNGHVTSVNDVGDEPVKLVVTGRSSVEEFLRQCEERCIPSGIEELSVRPLFFYRTECE